MRDAVRLIYISRSTTETSNDLEFDPGVAMILAKSRTNNRKNGLYGVLYFGNGCFFQCLEGPAEKVDALYLKLHDDPRHKDLKLLSREKIQRLSFDKWDMKYVKLDQAINTFMKGRGYKTFDPYSMDDRTIEDLIQFLRMAPAADGVENADAAPASPATALASPGMAQLSLAFSALAMLLSIGALVISLQ